MTLLEAFSCALDHGEDFTVRRASWTEEPVGSGSVRRLFVTDAVPYICVRFSSRVLQRRYVAAEFSIEDLYADDWMVVDGGVA